MSRLAVATALLRMDGLRLARDRFLIGTGLYIVAISVAMRWVIPWAGRAVAARWGFDLTPYHGLIVSYIVVQLAPLLVGIVGAFLLLESREDRTITAFLVSPVPLSFYLFWVSGAMVLTSTALALGEAIVIGHGLPPWPGLVASASVGALAAPCVGLSVSALATSKTEAFAYLKVVGVAPLLVSASYFLAEPIQWIAAIYPPYWAVKAYWIADAGGSGVLLWIAGGVATATAWLVPTVRLFQRAARR